MLHYNEVKLGVIISIILYIDQLYPYIFFSWFILLQEQNKYL